MRPARREPLSIWLQGPTSAGAGPERSATSHADRPLSSLCVFSARSAASAGRLLYSAFKPLARV